MSLFKLNLKKKHKGIAIFNGPNREDFFEHHHEFMTKRNDVIETANSEQRTSEVCIILRNWPLRRYDRVDDGLVAGGVLRRGRFAPALRGVVGGEEGEEQQGEQRHPDEEGLFPNADVGAHRAAAVSDVRSPSCPETDAGQSQRRTPTDRSQPANGLCPQHDNVAMSSRFPSYSP